MTTALWAVLYGAGAFFVVACAVRAIRYATAPVHLRWELYPIPKHGPGQLRAMGVEILFLKGLWESNRALWWRSYPFHLGLYLTIASLPLALIGPAAVARVAGVGGAVLILAGAAGLLLRRLSNPELVPYTNPADKFNLLFFIATFGCLLAGYLVERPSVTGLLAALLRFDTSATVPGVFAAGLFLAAALAAYIPCTHMAHFIAKYFAYHEVRWDESSNGRIARSVARYLGWRPTWAAPHIGADGTKTWAEIAKSKP